MKIFLLSIFLFLCLIMSSFDSFGQIDKLEKRNLFKLNVNTTVGVSNGRSVAGVWNKANGSVGISTEFGVSLCENFWLNAGVSLDFFRYRSAPFVHSGSKYHFYGLTAGGEAIGWWMDFEEDFERISERSSTYLTFPVSLEYSSPKIRGWYGKGGVSFGGNWKDEEINRRNDDKSALHWTDGVVAKIGTPYSRFSLFLNLSGGFQYRKEQVVYKIGLAYDHILANYDYYSWERGLHSFRLEFGLQREFRGKHSAGR